jgi:hypothetical protein
MEAQTTRLTATADNSRAFHKPGAKDDAAAVGALTGVMIASLFFL